MKPATRLATGMADVPGVAIPGGLYQQPAELSAHRARRGRVHRRGVISSSFRANRTWRHVASGDAIQAKSHSWSSCRIWQEDWYAKECRGAQPQDRDARRRAIGRDRIRPDGRRGDDVRSASNLPGGRRSRVRGGGRARQARSGRPEPRPATTSRSSTTGCAVPSSSSRRAKTARSAWRCWWTSAAAWPWRRTSMRRARRSTCCCGGFASGQDEVALFSFDRGLTEHQAFTKNPAAIRDALTGLQPVRDHVSLRRDRRDGATGRDARLQAEGHRRPHRRCRHGEPLDAR